MKEQFRNWNFNKQIKIKYTDAAGSEGIWEKDQQDLLDEITDIVESYVEQYILLTNRQLYYQLVARGIIPNADKVYKRICSFLTNARYAGLIDWSAIEDRGRQPSKHPEWDNISGLIESALASYRLPRWENQEFYLELYCEKQAMESILKPVADNYHIHFGVNKGYSSASTIYDLAQRIKIKIRKEKKAVVLYLGDHDASGLDMVRDIQERVFEFITGGDDPACSIYDNDYFQVVQLALNMEQIEKYDPPPNPAKITDPRAKWYINKFGNNSWELDALEPKVLMQISEDGIRKFLDDSKYNTWILLEENDKEALIEFGNSLRKE